MVLSSSYYVANQLMSSSFSRNSCMRWWIVLGLQGVIYLTLSGVSLTSVLNTSIVSRSHPAFFIGPPKSLARYTHSPVITDASQHPSSSKPPFLSRTGDHKKGPTSGTRYHPLSWLKRDFWGQKTVYITLSEASQLCLARNLEFRHTQQAISIFSVILEVDTMICDVVSGGWDTAIKHPPYFLSKPYCCKSRRL